MAEKIIKGRSVQKHDTAEHWALANNFIPKEGEIIIYDVDASNSAPRMKIGNGVLNVNALPFVNDEIKEQLESGDTVVSESTHSTSADTASGLDATGVAQVKAIKVDSATTADTATKATKDASGNVITDTYATKTALNTVSTLVGDTAVSTQISNAVSSINTIIYQDSDDHINIDRKSEDYMESKLKITGRDIIFTDYAMDEYPIIDILNDKSDKGHNHDDRYYTETEIDTKFSKLVGNTPVATQISNAVEQKSAVQFITWEAND